MQSSNKPPSPTSEEIQETHRLINKTRGNSNSTSMRPSEMTEDGKIPVFEKKSTSFFGKIGQCVQGFTASGSIPSSTFSLIVMCLGSGTVTIPYVFYANGLILSSVLICLGGLLSYYTGYLIAYCAAKTGANSFEEIACKLYGEKGMRIVSFCNIAANIGFVINYAVLFKTSMPKTLEQLGVDLPSWIDSSFVGKTVWDTIYCFLFLIPLCLPMELQSLRYISMLSIGITFFIVGVIIALCFNNTLFGDSQDAPFPDRMHTAFTTNRTSLDSVFSALPYIIFSFMYQPCIPQIYHEIKDKSMAKMQMVLISGTIITCFAYIMVGIFGYVTFANRDNVKKLFDEDKNVLDYYPAIPIAESCLIGILFIVIFAAPFCVCPAKMAIMEIVNKPGEQKTWKQNVTITISILVLTYIIALVCNDIGDAMSILGPTTNTAIGFVVPIFLYLKYDEIAHLINLDKNNEDEELWRLKSEGENSHKPITACTKYTAYTVMGLMFVCSVLQFYSYIKEKINGTEG